MPKSHSQFSVAHIAAQIAKEVQSLKTPLKTQTVGEIIETGDGVAKIGGLSSAMYGEILEFPKATYGLVLNLERDSIGAIILGPSQHLKEGDQVRSTGKLLNVPVGDALIGRVVDPLGKPIDGKPAPLTRDSYPVERIAPGVITREPVTTPLQTGIKAIDSMIPIGRGQRELIIGDRKTGKSAIPLTTIINQKGTGVICIYVAIGQKASFVARLVAILEKFGAMKHTIVVAATAASPASAQYLAPYAGCAMGEYFADRGKDVLIVYDDLSKHAWAYREVSLLLKRPSGREAYPGDIFYLHSRLLERACKLNKANGGGSLTALPIIETQEGDVSAYIPTNIISITDGQIYLEPDLFYSGIKPAINVGISVSRVGGAAQIKAMKQVSGRLKLDFAQYSELAAFAQFASDLDETTQSQLDRGARITEIFKQGWDKPMAVEDQVVIIWSATNGYLDEVDMKQIKDWEQLYLDYIHAKHGTITDEIRLEKKVSEALEKRLAQATTKFNETHPKLLKTVTAEEK